MGSHIFHIPHALVVVSLDNDKMVDLEISDALFGDLGGSPPKADFIAVVRDQLWTANIDEGSGRVPFRVRWSGINDATSFTTGTDQSDFQDIVDVGDITGLVGGEYAVILTEKAILRASYVGTPLISEKVHNCFIVS